MANEQQRATPEIGQVLSDPSASFWLKAAIRSAMERDAVDAANDARVLAYILESRASVQLSKVAVPPAGPR